MLIDIIKFIEDSKKAFEVVRDVQDPQNLKSQLSVAIASIKNSENALRFHGIITDTPPKFVSAVNGFLEEDNADGKLNKIAFKIFYLIRDFNSNELIQRLNENPSEKKKFVDLISRCDQYLEVCNNLLVERSPKKAVDSDEDESSELSDDEDSNSPYSSTTTTYFSHYAPPLQNSPQATPTTTTSPSLPPGYRSPAVLSQGGKAGRTINYASWFDDDEEEENIARDRVQNSPPPGVTTTTTTTTSRSPASRGAAIARLEKEAKKGENNTVYSSFLDESPAIPASSHRKKKEKEKEKENDNAKRPSTEERRRQELLKKLPKLEEELISLKKELTRIKNIQKADQSAPSETWDSIEKFREKALIFVREAEIILDSNIFNKNDKQKINLTEGYHLCLNGYREISEYQTHRYGTFFNCSFGESLVSEVVDKIAKGAGRRVISDPKEKEAKKNPVPVKKETKTPPNSYGTQYSPWESTTTRSTPPLSPPTFTQSNGAPYGIPFGAAQRQPLPHMPSTMHAWAEPTKPVNPYLQDDRLDEVILQSPLVQAPPRGSYQASPVKINLLRALKDKDGNVSNIIKENFANVYQYEVKPATPQHSEHMLIKHVDATGTPTGVEVLITQANCVLRIPASAQSDMALRKAVTEKMLKTIIEANTNNALLMLKPSSAESYKIQRDYLVSKGITNFDIHIQAHPAAKAEHQRYIATQPSLGQQPQLPQGHAGHAESDAQQPVAPSRTLRV
jgi:hypothetical protein